MSHFSCLILISVESNYDTVEDLRLWGFAYKQEFFCFRCTSKAIEES